MTAGGSNPAQPGRTPRGAFPRAQRVRRRQEFTRIQDEARRLTTPHLALLLHAAPEHQGRSQPRLGVTVTRRVGGAVLRNRLKRLLREAFRATRDLWHPELDVVVVVRRVPPAPGLGALVEELLEAAPRIQRRTLDALTDRARRQELPTP